jgi:manganese/zinc/iron transport system substrate-binding protein
MTLRLSHAAWFALPFIIGCSQGSANNRHHIFSGPYPIKTVCTTGMVADLVRHVGGPHVIVDQLMGQDVDPHLFKASSGDVRRLNAADIVFYSGLHLEGKMGAIFESMAQKRPAVAVADRLDNVLHNEEGTHDPHVWFDASLWSQAAGTVRDALVKFDSKNAGDYQARAEAYQGELAKLHEYAKTQIAIIPKERRVLVTAHDAFRYFGRAYDIEVKGIQGISTDAEASVKDINDLVDFIVQRKIKAVFIETSVSSRNMRSLIEGCKARGHEVQIGGELFSDAMGKDGTLAGTYPGMVKHNVDTIVGALK